MSEQGVDLRAEVVRLRARTHEIQAEEMAKRADLDRELARFRSWRQWAKQWTEQVGLARQLYDGTMAPFWTMTFEADRLVLADLVASRDEARAERDAARADLAALRAGIERLLAEHSHHADTCASELSPGAVYPCTCWRGDALVLIAERPDGDQS